MKIEEGYLVKTYELNEGEVAIACIENILDRDVEIDCWRGTNELKYKDEKEFRKISNNTIIWDKSNRRYVFKHNDYERKGYACFSTVVVDVCEPDVAMWRFLVNDEKIKNKLH